jgi:hypothetical protein
MPLVIPNEARYQTLVGGIEFGPCRGVEGNDQSWFGQFIEGEVYSKGTLGVIMLDKKNEPYALTNYHVVCLKENWKAKDENMLVVQPSPQEAFFNDCSSNNADFVGRITAGVYGDGPNGISLDCAVVRLEASLGPDPKRGFQVGTVLGENGELVRIAGVYTGDYEDLLGVKVWKIGRTTGYTTSIIEDAKRNFAGLDNQEWKQQISLSTLGENSKFARPGDSGSLVLTVGGDTDLNGDTVPANIVVGLLRGSYRQTTSTGKNYSTVVVPFKPILKYFKDDYDFSFEYR